MKQYFSRSVRLPTDIATICRRFDNADCELSGSAFLHFAAPPFKGATEWHFTRFHFHEYDYFRI